MRIWPDAVREEGFSSGFSSRLIKDLVGRKRGFWEAFPKFSPIAFWETETYSFGKTYRHWLKWPWYLPLPMIGDHGVNLKRKYTVRELNPKAKTYVTWSSWRNMEPNTNSRVVRIQHPWVTYRRDKRIEPKPDRLGTLIFISHTTSRISRAEFDFGKYFSELSDLPEAFHPLAICIQMHDVRKGLHLELERFGLPIFTAGNSSSPFFVDRFYDLLSRFKFATSNVAGSQLFYSEEMGVPYFLYGPHPTERLDGGPVRSYYEDDDADLVEKAHRLFQLERVGEDSDEKLQFVSETLGLDSEVKISAVTLRARLKSDLLRSFPHLLGEVFKNTLQALGSLVKR